MLSFLLLVQSVAPSSWVGTGVSYNPTGSPKWTSTLSYAKILDKTKKIYSFSSYDETYKKWQVPTVSTRTGFMLDSLQIGNLHLLVNTTAGVSQTTTATTVSVAAGGILIYQFKRGWTFDLGYRSANSAAGGRTVMANFGYMWGQ